MPKLSPSASHHSGVAALVLCSALVACGGGGGGSDAGATAAPASGGVSAGAPATAASSASASTGSSNSTGSSQSGSTVSTVGVGIADAVNTVHALSVSAMLTLGLPVTPDPAPALALTANHVYHVDSANGADTNDGLAATATGTAGSGPWRTLARIAAASLAAGDRIELACGSTWHETLRVPVDGAAGAPIVVAQPAAGCTTLPSIDGSVTLAPSAWTPYQGKIYKAPLGATPLQLFATTGLMTVAHFPNGTDVAADPGSPYFALAADSSGAVLTTGPDFALPAGATLDATTQVHVRTNAWMMDVSAVSAFDGTHITLAKAPTYTVPSGWGYFLTGQLWMLRSAGQWWYDPAAQQLYAWMPDSAAPGTPVGVSTLPVGIDLQGRNHVVVDGVAVHGVGLGVDARSTTDVTLRNMLVEDIADIGIDVGGSSNDVIQSNGIARTGGDAVTGWGGAMSPLIADASAMTVTNNVIRDSGVQLNGDVVLSVPRRSLAALFIGNNSTASGNVIVNAGYLGILAQLGTTVTNNFVYGACSVLDDCGGIYTGSANNGSHFVGNTVVHSRGALFGQPVAGRSTSAQGIYVDDRGSDVLVQSNTVIDADFGIQLHNTARNTLQSNRLFANRRGQVWMQEDSNQVNSNGDMVGNVVGDNQVAPVAANAVGLLLTTTFANTAAFGSFSGNRFYDRISSAVAVNGASQGSQVLTFGAWSGSTGYGSTQAVDTQGKAISTSGFAAYTTTGGNIVPNGALQPDASGWNSWNATAPAGQMTRFACPAGQCLQYVAGGSSGILSSPGFALQQGAWYRLTIDVSTQTDNQTVPLIVRRGSGDYASLSDRGLAFPASRAWSRHSVVFQATQTVTGSGARVDFDSVVAGQSLSVARLQIVQIAPDAATQMSSVVVNAAATPLSASCPFTGTLAPLCADAYDLATQQPVAWPLSVPAHSAVIVYVQDPALVDSDGDGIPDSMDTCPGTAAGAAVDASGCPLILQ